jgi:DNA repair protein RecO (recombination protein O)
MAIQKTEAIVLRNQNFRESSLIVNFYTRDFGKITGLVKGIKTRRRKYTSYLQPFSYNEITFYERVHSGLHTISQCDLKDFFPVIRQDLEKIAYASYFLELVDKTSPLEDKNINLFNLLLGSLRLLSDENARKVVHIFEIKFLGLLGLMPVVTRCVYCNNRIGEEIKFSSLLGGLLCKQCFFKDGQAVPVLKGTIASINHINGVSYQQALRLKLTQEVEKNLGEILRIFLDFHLEKKLKSVEFLEKISKHMT